MKKQEFESLVSDQFASHIAAFKDFFSAMDDIIAASGMVVNALESGGKILICGNGGSAADSQHFAAEIVGHFEVTKSPLPAIALTTDSSVLTALSNDFGYQGVFARQVEALGNSGDLLVAISTSGESENILQAVQAAKSKQLGVVGLSGKTESALSEGSDVCIMSLCSRTARTQELHIFALHCICSAIDAHFVASADE